MADNNGRPKVDSWHFAFKANHNQAVDAFMKKRYPDRVVNTSRGLIHEVVATTEEDANELAALIRSQKLTAEEGDHYGTTIEGTLHFRTHVVTR